MTYWKWAGKPGIRKMVSHTDSQYHCTYHPPPSQEGHPPKPLLRPLSTQDMDTTPFHYCTKHTPTFWHAYRSAIITAFRERVHICYMDSHARRLPGRSCRGYRKHPLNTLKQGVCTPKLAIHSRFLKISQLKIPKIIWELIIDMSESQWTRRDTCVFI